ncbi:MAG TPA: hypothetical protein VM409_05010 [Chloroflexia bacterium]|nr:hypothetical protein [Chloroflexia bacterium]
MTSTPQPDSGDPDHHFAPPSPPSSTDYRHARSQRLVGTSLPVRKVDAGLTSWEGTDPRHVTIVGVCSAGKSTLARALREKGYRVRTCAQEHSYVPHLWQLSAPDLLVYLDATLPTIRRRRHVRWNQNRLDDEHERLAHAREHCHLYIPTDGLLPEDVASKVLTYLNNTRPASTQQLNSNP